MALYLTILVACCKFSDVPRAKRVAQLALQLEPLNPSVFVLISNMFRDAGLVQEEQLWQACSMIHLSYILYC